MTNRLVKTAYVTYTPAVPEVVGRPAYCITIDTPKVGANNPIGQNRKPAFKNGYWVDGTPEVASDPEYGADWR